MKTYLLGKTTWYQRALTYYGALLAILALGACLRICNIEKPPVFVDEAANILTHVDPYINQMMQPLTLGRPLLNLLFAPAHWMFLEFSVGDLLINSRLQTAITGVVNIILAICIAAQLSNGRKKSIVVAAFLIAVCPYFLVHDRMALQDPFTGFLILSATTLLLRLLSRSNLKIFSEGLYEYLVLTLSALLILLGILNKIIVAFLLPWFVGLWFYIQKRRNRKFFTREVITVGIVLSPVVYWATCFAYRSFKRLSIFDHISSDDIEHGQVLSFLQKAVTNAYEFIPEFTQYVSYLGTLAVIGTILLSVRNYHYRPLYFGIVGVFVMHFALLGERWHIRYYYPVIDLLFVLVGVSICEDSQWRYTIKKNPIRLFFLLALAATATLWNYKCIEIVFNPHALRVFDGSPVQRHRLYTSARDSSIGYESVIDALNSKLPAGRKAIIYTYDQGIVWYLKLLLYGNSQFEFQPIVAHKPIFGPANVTNDYLAIVDAMHQSMMITNQDAYFLTQDELHPNELLLGGQLLSIQESFRVKDIVRDITWKMFKIISTNIDQAQRLTPAQEISRTNSPSYLGAKVLLSYDVLDSGLSNIFLSGQLAKGLDRNITVTVRCDQKESNQLSFYQSDRTVRLCVPRERLETCNGRIQLEFSDWINALDAGDTSNGYAIHFRTRVLENLIADYGYKGKC